MHYVKKWKLIFIPHYWWRWRLSFLVLALKKLGRHATNHQNGQSIMFILFWILHEDSMHLFILKTKLHFWFCCWKIQWWMSFENYLRHNFKRRNLHFLWSMHARHEMFMEVFETPIIFLFKTRYLSQTTTYWERGKKN